MTARPNLYVVGKESGEIVGETDALILELNKRIATLAAENTRLKNEAAEREGTGLHAKDIEEVLRFHKQVFPGGKIVRNGPAWKNVKARLRDVDAETDRPAFTVLSLKAAVVGLSMSGWHREHRKTGAAFLFDNPDRVQEFIGHAVTFKRETGTSGLAIIDELGRGGYERLAALCSHCGRTRLEHEREPDGQGLFDPLCPGFDSFDWEIDVWKRQRDRVAAERAMLEDELA